MTSHLEEPRLRANVITALRLISMSACLGMLALPALNMVVPIFEQKELSGVLPDSPCPEPSWSELFTEKLQSGFTRCFEQRYGGRPTATRLDNSVAYWIFGETPPEKRLRVGTNRVLYIDEQINFYNRQDRPDPGAMAAKIKRAQDLLLARGKVFVLMVIPTKTSLWPDDVPEGWRREGSSWARTRSAISDPYVKALEAAGVRFVDGRTSVRSLPREVVYAKTGRHLTPPAACTVLEDALALARPLIHDAEVPRIECSFQMRRGAPVAEEDFDLFRLLNVFSPPPSNAIPIMEPMAEVTPRERRVDAVVVGSSFGWGQVYEAERTHAFRHISYHYYSSLLYDRGGLPSTPLVLGSKAWQDLMASATLFLYPAPEEYLVVDGEAFVDAVIAMYSAGNAASDAVTR